MEINTEAIANWVAAKAHYAESKRRALVAAVADVKSGFALETVARAYGVSPKLVARLSEGEVDALTD